ncbi:MAG: HNH endonuclease [Desulfitobacteriaceae bacterium]
MNEYLFTSVEAGGIALHRLVVERYMGRPLEEYEVVHHMNEEKDDNRVENLVVFVDNAHHVKFHKAKSRPKYVAELGRSKAALKAKMLEKYGIVFYGPLFKGEGDKNLKQMAERTKRELGLIR